MVVMIAGAFLAVGSSNILHAVFGLAVSLVGVAGCFLALGSPFVAVMEVLIYVGGISVTMIFAVMLSSVASPQDKESWSRRIMAAIIAFWFLAGGAFLIAHADFGAAEQVSREHWGLEAVGRSLLDRFNLAFETLSIVLLLAIVGAIVISRKEPVLPNTEPTKEES
jgi:NADH-quinone oxidoreductase subunit J